MSNVKLKSTFDGSLLTKEQISCAAAQILLLAWFFLVNIGIYIGDNCLVTRSEEDRLFFVIHCIVLLWFTFREKTGKWVMSVWLLLWFITQFFSHEWYTIFGRGFMGSLEIKMKYFSQTIHWLRIEGRYIPDVYHTILHILILSALITTIIYILRRTANGKI